MKILFNTQTQLLQPYPRADDEDVIGLDPIYLTYNVIQDSAPVYDPGTQYLQPFENVDHEADEVHRGWNIVDNPAQILSVTMTSMRFALIDAELYDSVVAGFAAIVDSVEKLKAQVWWDTARTVERNHPLVLSLSAALGQTNEQVDNLFILAKQKDTTL